MRNYLRSVLPILGIVCLFSLLASSNGCGPSDGLKKTIVRGTVTFNDQPIANGEVRFYPIDGTAGSVSGGPINDGKYVAKSRGGVPVGKHRVEIRAYRAPRKAARGDLAVEGGPAEQYLPARFNALTELRADVDRSTKKLDFNLSE